MALCVKEKTQMLEYFLDLTATCPLVPCNPPASPELAMAGRWQAGRSRPFTTRPPLLSRRRVSEFSRDPGTGRNSEAGGSALCAVLVQRK